MPANITDTENAANTTKRSSDNKNAKEILGECIATLSSTIDKLREYDDADDATRAAALHARGHTLSSPLFLGDLEKLSPLLSALSDAIQTLHNELDNEKSKIPALAARCESVVRENQSLREALQQHDPESAIMSSSSCASNTLIRQQNAQLRRAVTETREQAASHAARAAQLTQTHEALRVENGALREKIAGAEAALRAARERGTRQAARAAAAEHEARERRLDAAAATEVSKALALRASRALRECVGVTVRQRALTRALAHRNAATCGVTLCAKAQSVVAQLSQNNRSVASSKGGAENAGVDEIQHALGVERAARADAEFEAVRLRETLESVLAGSVARHDHGVALAAREQRAQEAEQRAAACAEEAAAMRVRADRAARDAAGVASELERVRAAAAADAARASLAYDACSARVVREEKQRIELAQQLAAATVRHEASSGAWAQERQHLDDERRHFERVAKRSDAALDELRVELRSLAGKVAAAQRAENEAVVQMDELRRQQK